MITRKQISLALYNYLKADAGVLAVVNGFFRRYRTLDQVEPANKPCLIVMKAPGGEDYPSRNVNGMPPKRTLDFWLLVYTEVTEQNAEYTPEDTASDIMDAIDVALKTPAGQQAQTLGGLVYSCWIEGKIDWVSGDIDGKGFLKIPVKIVVP